MDYKKRLFFKLIFIIFFVICSTAQNINANIIYSKDRLLITENELNSFIKIYQEIEDIKLSKSIAIKKLILQKKTLTRLLKNQESFLKELDKNIQLEFGENSIKDKNFRDFIRYSKIRNDFIINYFNNTFSQKDLELALKELNNLTFPLSKNGCMTIIEKKELSKNKLFIENLYLKFKENVSNIDIIINDQNYSVCLSQKDLKKIENAIVKIIENKTEIEFKTFIYAK
ncbi:hypothetical protein N9440_00280 [Alphaproteobacteria bacterium]|nr:hypothetical protein [Alphaproteobacteria bacterium]